MIHEPIFQIMMDTIPNPVIITNEVNLVKCNRSFFDFFNYTDLERFTQHNNCVCDLFIHDDDYFSLASIDKDTLWTDYIYNNDKDYEVSILNQDGEPRAFSPNNSITFSTPPNS